jgi:uncharacterized protein (TIGR03067 family)
MVETQSLAAKRRMEFMIDTKSKSHFILAIVLLIAPACTGRSSDSPKVANLTGEYRIISGERNGALIDQKELSDATITIRDKTITAYDKERKETFAATYTLETKQTPWEITMISTKAPEVGVIAKGLIEIKQNSVKLIYALPNGQPPTDFKAGQQQQMFDMVKIDQASG